jgi:hypothetical protein
MPLLRKESWRIAARNAMPMSPGIACEVAFLEAHREASFAKQKAAASSRTPQAEGRKRAHSRSDFNFLEGDAEAGGFETRPYNHRIGAGVAGALHFRMRCKGQI